MKGLGAVLCGLLVAAGVIAALHLPLTERRASLETQLREREAALDRLKVVRVQVDAYQRARTRLDQQIEWIKRERETRKCPWPLPGLEFEGAPGVRIDGIVVEGSTLVLSGTAARAAVDQLAGVVRGAPWAREVEAGSANAEASPFGLFAKVDLPRCQAAEPGATP